jgi:hypothetical protein
MKKIAVILILLFLVSGLIFAENVINLDKADLVWSLEGDNLTISLKAETEGWLAVGLGSSRMDGSQMFLGYNAKGEAFFEEHLGKGHSHKKTPVQRPVEYEVTESNGVTEMVFTVKKSDFVKVQESELSVIVAYGSRDNFSSMHRYRDSAVIKF